jgi:hypothetical protein
VKTAHPAISDAARVGEDVERRRYEIVVRGRLSNRLGSAFAGLEIEPRPGRTALTGEFADQSELHGVLDRLADFGIELESVNALD